MENVPLRVALASTLFGGVPCYMYNARFEEEKEKKEAMREVKSSVEER